MTTGWEKLMDVRDIDRRPGMGLVIAGTDELIGFRFADLRCFVGTSIQIRRATGSIAEVPLLDVRVATSLSGGRNIFLLVSEDAKLDSGVAEVWVPVPGVA